LKDHKPIYLLKYSDKEIESDNVEDLIRLAKNISAYWELFRVMKSPVHKSENRSYLTCNDVDEIKRLRSKGYSAKIICSRLHITKDRFQLVEGQNAII
jgi:hypothetical protein